MSEQKRWYLGSMNDGPFIIDHRPCKNEEGCFDDCPNAPDLVLNVTALTHSQAQAVVDAHNADIASPDSAGPTRWTT